MSKEKTFVVETLVPEVVIKQGKAAKCGNEWYNVSQFEDSLSPFRFEKGVPSKVKVNKTTRGNWIIGLGNDLLEKDSGVIVPVSMKNTDINYDRTSPKEIGRRGLLQAAVVAVAQFSATQDELVENALKTAKSLEAKLGEWVS